MEAIIKVTDVAEFVSREDLASLDGQRDVLLAPDSDRPQDRHAVRVLICDDDAHWVHVGYLPGRARRCPGCASVVIPDSIDPPDGQLEECPSCQIPYSTFAFARTLREAVDASTVTAVRLLEIDLGEAPAIPEIRLALEWHDPPESARPVGWAGGGG